MGMVESLESLDMGHFVWHDRGFWLGSIELPAGKSANFTVAVSLSQRAEVLPLARAAAARAIACEERRRRQRRRGFGILL